MLSRTRVRSAGSIQGREEIKEIGTPISPTYYNSICLLMLNVSERVEVKVIVQKVEMVV